MNDLFNLIKSIDITVRSRPALFSVPYWNEEPRPPAVEIYRNMRTKYEKWEIGIWTWNHKDSAKIVGLLYEGWPTHFAYYLDDFYLDPRDPAEGGYFFDAGTSCKELYVEPNEWKRVLDELGINYWAMARDSKMETETESNRETDLSQPLAD